MPLKPPQGSGLPPVNGREVLKDAVLWPLSPPMTLLIIRFKPRARHFPEEIRWMNGSSLMFFVGFLAYLVLAWVSPSDVRASMSTIGAGLAVSAVLYTVGALLEVQSYFWNYMNLHIAFAIQSGILGIWLAVWAVVWIV
jgi:hypothetical protein